MTNFKIGNLRPALLIINLAILGCTWDVNRNIPFSYSSLKPISAVLGLYFPPKASGCDNTLANSSIGQQYRPEVRFRIDEMTIKFWPKVFNTVFQKVHVLNDISADISSKELDLIAEVRCTSFSAHLRTDLVTFKDRSEWRGVYSARVNFLITYSCPKGEHSEAYAIEEKYSHFGYPKGGMFPNSFLIHKLFEKTGRAFIERTLLDAEALYFKCDSYNS